MHNIPESEWTPMRVGIPAYAGSPTHRYYWNEAVLRFVVDANGYVSAQEWRGGEWMPFMSTAYAAKPLTTQESYDLCVMKCLHKLSGFCSYTEPTDDLTAYIRIHCADVRKYEEGNLAPMTDCLKVVYDEDGEPCAQMQREHAGVVQIETELAQIGLQQDGHDYVDDDTWAEITDAAGHAIEGALYVIRRGSDLPDGLEEPSRELADIIAQRWLNGTDWRHCGFFLRNCHRSLTQGLTAYLDELMCDIDDLKALQVQR